MPTLSNSHVHTANPLHPSPGASRDPDPLQPTKTRSPNRETNSVYRAAADVTGSERLWEETGERGRERERRHRRRLRFCSIGHNEHLQPSPGETMPVEDHQVRQQGQLRRKNL
ncbi:hypothetical protein INR49_029209 [Caranx melampygus]|nr:hypothetical protein INR49_029209 [Caranx melampygus]